jgi:IS30 family transposase
MKTKYSRLTLAKREEISRGLWADENFSQIARRIDIVECITYKIAIAI